VNGLRAVLSCLNSTGAIEMKVKKRLYVMLKISMILFWTIAWASNGFGELKLESVYPTLGVLGKELEVTLTGTGCDENTRVSMYIDAGNKRDIIGSVDTPGDALDVTVVGDKAYVADGISGSLQVIDITDPASPQIISGRQSLYGGSSLLPHFSPLGFRD